MTRASDLAKLLGAGGTVNAATKITTSDNLTQLTLESGDGDANVGPVLDLHRNSATPADNDVIGIVNFAGENDASEVIDYASINAYAVDVTDGTEDGRIIHRLYKDGTNLNYFDFKSNEAVFNEDSADLDFRVEGNGDTHALFVQGSDDNVGINNSSPVEMLTIGTTSDSASRIQFLSATNGASTIHFGDGTSADAYRGYINYAHNTDSLQFAGAGAEIFRSDSSNNFMIGITSSDHKFMVNQTTVNKIAGFFYNNTSTNAACLKVLQDGAGASGPALLIRQDGSGNAIEVDDGSDGNTVFRVAENGRTYIPEAYTSTTGNSANLFIDTDGRLIRATSSERYKNTITDATHGLAEVLKLRSVTYKGNNDGDTVFGGLIAEEVHKAGLTEFVQYNKANEPDALAYGNMVSLCIKAIQELEARITALESA